MESNLRARVHTFKIVEWQDDLLPLFTRRWSLPYSGGGAASRSVGNAGVCIAPVAPNME